MKALSQLIYLFKTFMTRFKSGQVLKFDFFASQTIFAVAKLDHIIITLSNCSIITNHHSFHSFDQTTLNVA